MQNVDCTNDGKIENTTYVYEETTFFFLLDSVVTCA